MRMVSPGQASSRAEIRCLLLDRPIPRLQRPLELAHELPRIRPIDQPMVEPKAVILHRPDRNRVVALGICEHHRLFLERADGEDRRFRLVDDGYPKLIAKDSRVGQRER